MRALTRDSQDATRLIHLVYHEQYSHVDQRFCSENPVMNHEAKGRALKGKMSTGKGLWRALKNKKIGFRERLWGEGGVCGGPGA